MGNIMVRMIFRTNQDMSKPLHTGNTNLSLINRLLVGVGIGLEEKYMLYYLAVLTTKFGQSLGLSITNSMRLTYS